MNTLGKVLTVAILVACLFVMIGAFMVYSTHTNWSARYNQVKQQLQDVQTAAQEAETRYGNEISQLKAESEAMQQEVRKLESERVELVGQNAAIQSEVDQLRLQRRENEGLVAATEANNARLTDEVGQLRGSIRENQEFRDKAFASTLKATSELHVAAGDLAQVKERNAQLVGQVAQGTSLLRENGIDPTAKSTPRVRGKIAYTRRVDGHQLIEITVGADDGIAPGQTVEIFRGDRYLGRAEILRADPDRAVGRVLTRFQRGQIQEDDDVATKLRVG